MKEKREREMKIDTRMQSHCSLERQSQHADEIIVPSSSSISGGSDSVQHQQQHHNHKLLLSSPAPSSSSSTRRLPHSRRVPIVTWPAPSPGATPPVPEGSSRDDPATRDSLHRPRASLRSRRPVFSRCSRCCRCSARDSRKRACGRQRTARKIWRSVTRFSRSTDAPSRTRRTRRYSDTYTRAPLCQCYIPLDEQLVCASRGVITKICVIPIESVYDRC
ncbi:unnamed protein product, partial [Trichogramma brassicae]